MLLRPNYQYNWSDDDDDDNSVCESEQSYRSRSPSPLPWTSSSSTVTCMISDIKTQTYANRVVNIKLSLMNEYGEKLLKLIQGDVFFDVYIETWNRNENIARILNQLQCYNNTPQFVDTKYTAMGYSQTPLNVWRLNIRENRLDYIYEFCQSSGRRMFLNTELNDALPMVQKNLGIYCDIPNVGDTAQIPYSSLTKPDMSTPKSFICRKLSIDIEVITPPEWTLFPDATELGCEIIIIACTRQQDDTTTYQTDILYTDSQHREIHIENADNRNFIRFDTEYQMLEYFITSIDPHNTDLLTGWNVRNFDLKYIYDRCCKFFPDLVAKFRQWTLDGSDISFRNVTRKGQNVTLVESFGIMILDMYDYNKSNVKAKSYKLKDIARKYLREDKQKLDIDYKDISRFYRSGNTKEFSHLLEYCSVDAEIVLDLMAVQKVWNNTVSMADICHVPMNYVVNSGVMLRNTCMISQFVNEHTDYLLPYKHEMPFTSYEGGYVNEPIVGFHTDPIFVLDFNSLYPTTMLAFNICTTTIVDMREYSDTGYPVDAIPSTSSSSDTTPYQPTELDQVVFTTSNELKISATPYMHNVGFVAANHRRGVMPQILHNLLTTRKRLQNELKKTTDDQKRKQLDAQQLSYKLCANAIYGLLGCSFSPLYNPMVAASVTSFGRFLSYIKRKRITEYMAAENIEGSIVYGDTDSVMVQIRNHTIAETKAIAERYAEQVTRDIGIPPIRTEYEKIFCPFLIHKKKHYIGVMYTDNCDRHLRVEYKGNEMVRSDNCTLTTDVMRDVIDLLFFGDGDLTQKNAAITRRLEELLAEWSQLYGMYREGTPVDRELRARVVQQAIYSKKLAKEVYTNRLPHVAVYERMKNRKQYHIGDRIVYCIANTELSDRVKPKNIIDMAYDIDEFLEDERLYLAVHYYADACVRKPLSRLFASLDSQFRTQLELTLSRLFPSLVASAQKRAHKDKETAVLCKQKKSCENKRQ